MSRRHALNWMLLIAALAVTTVGAAFAGPTGDSGCRFDPHPGVPPSEHWAEDRLWPPVWACRYDLLDGGVVWRGERYDALYAAAAVGALLLVLIVAFRRRPPLALQGLLVAWLVVAVFGALSTFDDVGGWVGTPLALPLIALYQHDLGRRLAVPALRWWWACAIAAAAWMLTVVISGLEGESNPLPALALGAALGAIRWRLLVSPQRPEPGVRSTLAA